MVRLLRVLALVFAGALLVAGGWWAGRVALEPPEDPLGVPVAILYEVVEGSVGRSLRFAAVAEWRVVDSARSGATGVVTSVSGVAQDATVGTGDVLFAIDLRPVIVGVGSTPMFRDLSLRVEGADVIQLQQLLSDLGFYDSELDGVFGASTRRAVRLWQESTGVPVDGVVRRGDIVFLPEVPVRVVLADAVTVGAPLSVGQVTVRRVVGDPVFMIPLVPEQRSLVPLEAAVLVSHGSGVWEGRISEVREDESRGQLLLVLEAVDGGPLCGSECVAEVPLSGRTNYSADVVVVPEMSGPIVPMSAIETGPDGSTSVRRTDGTEVQIVIVAASHGLAVVEGVLPGDMIQLPMTQGGSV